MKIATGTDCGSAGTRSKYYFDELLIMEEAGMTPIDVIKSSTAVTSACLDLKDRGTLTIGNKADLLIVDHNPYEDLRVLKEDKIIMKDGEFIQLTTSDQTLVAVK